MTTPLPKLTLVSHELCPYVQRVAIVLMEKQATFEQRYVDLSHKPEWFTSLSPLGKTPVLLVGDTPIFESAVICEYLEDTLSPPLHPSDALQRAQHRAWIEFGSAVLNNIAGFYNAPNETALLQRRDELAAKFLRLEAELQNHNAGPLFNGAQFSVVDAVFGPVFRYFEVFAKIADFELFANTPLVNAWRTALAERKSVQMAVLSDYASSLISFLKVRDSALSRRVA